MRMPEKILGSRRKKCDAWVRDQFDGPLHGLVAEYCRAPIVLYTGAGVSAGPSPPVKGKTYGLPTWINLLKSLVDPGAVTAWPTDPWEAADLAVRACGLATFRERLDAAIAHPDNYTGRYGQLTSPFVGNAPTLRATASFCGQLTGRIVNPGKPEQAKTHFRTAANPRVHAVLTANYDCFLESAASTLYRRSPLQPVTALGSSAASATRIPVFHIHGYVPHPFYQQGDRPPSVDRLVITRQDYEDVWDTNDVFGTTMAPQIHFLRYFTVLFLGFSFSDEYVCTLLRRINHDYLRHADRTHFALVSEQELHDRGEPFYSDLGVTPIPYATYAEIPELLGAVYRAGLAADNMYAGRRADAAVVLPELLVKVHRPTGRAYTYPQDNVWELMQHLRNESAGTKRVRQLGEIART